MTAGERVTQHPQRAETISHIIQQPTSCLLTQMMQAIKMLPVRPPD